MPVRATKRGVERTPLQRDCDVLICGASFAGLAVARELAGCGANVLVIDRYEIGDKQTSACGIPTLWLEKLDLLSSLRQTFDSLLVHTPWADSMRWSLPWTFSTFDYKELCDALWEQCKLPPSAFETAKVNGISKSHAPTHAPDTHVQAAHAPSAEAPHSTEAQHEPALHVVHTDRGDIKAPLVIDGLGWRRVLAQAMDIQPPNARLSRGLEVHPHGSGSEMELWIDPRYVRAGYGWSFPARDEIRVGVGSFWPSHHVKEPTVRLAHDLQLPPDGYQGNWIPHQMRPAVEGDVFFVGDSAGHCLPLTAEGIRTALYFGIACGREIRAVLDGSIDKRTALRRYSAFSDSHKWKFSAMLYSQRFVGRFNNTPIVTTIARGMAKPKVSKWAFEHYLQIAPPSFVDAGTPRSRAGVRRVAATA